MSNAQKESFVTPVGELRYPRLNEADTKFNRAGEFNTRIVISEKDLESIIEPLQQLHDEAVKEGREKYEALPMVTKKKKAFTEASFVTECLDEEGNFNGSYELVFKMKASGTDSKTGKAWSRRPAIFDSEGEVMNKVPAIWGGTTALISFTVMQYFMSSSCTAGISLKLEAVQIINLVSGGGSGAKASAFGFGKVSGGYKHVESETKSTPQDQGGDDSDFDGSEGIVISDDNYDF